MFYEAFKLANPTDVALFLKSIGKCVNIGLKLAFSFVKRYQKL